MIKRFLLFLYTSIVSCNTANVIKTKKAMCILYFGLFSIIKVNPSSVGTKKLDLVGLFTEGLPIIANHTSLSSTITSFFLCLLFLGLLKKNSQYLFIASVAILISGHFIFFNIRTFFGTQAQAIYFLCYAHVCFFFITWVIIIVVTQIILSRNSFNLDSTILVQNRYIRYIFGVLFLLSYFEYIYWDYTNLLLLFSFVYKSLAVLPSCLFLGLILIIRLVIIACCIFIICRFFFQLPTEWALVLTLFLFILCKIIVYVTFLI